MVVGESSGWGTGVGLVGLWLGAGANGDVVAPVKEWFSADLGEQYVDVEVALVDGVGGAVGEAAGLPFLGFGAGRPTGVEDHQFVGDAVGLGEEVRSFSEFEMAVEMTGEQSCDCLVGEWQGGGIAADDGDAGGLAAKSAQGGFALVDSDTGAGQQRGEDAWSGADVNDEGGRKGAESACDLLKLGADDLGVSVDAEFGEVLLGAAHPTLVVPGASVVVGPQRGTGARWRRCHISSLVAWPAIAPGVIGRPAPGVIEGAGVIGGFDVVQAGVPPRPKAGR